MHLISIKKRQRRSSNGDCLDEEGIFAGTPLRVMVADSNELFRHNTLIDVDDFNALAEASYSSDMLKQGARISVDMMLMGVALL